MPHDESSRNFNETKKKLDSMYKCIAQHDVVRSKYSRESVIQGLLQVPKAILMLSYTFVQHHLNYAVQNSEQTCGTKLNTCGSDSSPQPQNLADKGCSDVAAMLMTGRKRNNIVLLTATRKHAGSIWKATLTTKSPHAATKFTHVSEQISKANPQIVQATWETPQESNSNHNVYIAGVVTHEYTSTQNRFETSITIPETHTCTHLLYSVPMTRQTTNDFSLRSNLSSNNLQLAN